jgi:hypothetical protein
VPNDDDDDDDDDEVSRGVTSNHSVLTTSLGYSYFIIKQQNYNRVLKYIRTARLFVNYAIYCIKI